MLATVRTILAQTIEGSPNLFGDYMDSLDADDIDDITGKEGERPAVDDRVSLLQTIERYARSMIMLRQQDDYVTAFAAGDHRDVRFLGGEDYGFFEEQMVRCLENLQHGEHTSFVSRETSVLAARAIQTILMQPTNGQFSQQDFDPEVAAQTFMEQARQSRGPAPMMGTPN